MVNNGTCHMVIQNLDYPFRMGDIQLVWIIMERCVVKKGRYCPRLIYFTKYILPFKVNGPVYFLRYIDIFYRLIIISIVMFSVIEIYSPWCVIYKLKILGIKCDLVCVASVRFMWSWNCSCQSEIASNLTWYRFITQNLHFIGIICKIMAQWLIQQCDWTNGFPSPLGCYCTEIFHVFGQIR